jgi:alpha-L-fucosidase
MCKDQLPIAPEYIKNFEQLGLGMFVHFGLYSQLRQGEWTMHTHQIKLEDYMPLKETFNPVHMSEIVSVGKAAGCKYICLTTRHHEGFSLYDTCGLNDYDAIHSPAKRDVVREFVDECRKADIVPFFYHTTLDWYREDFKSDFNGYLEYLRKSVEILCTNYGEIGGLWFDGNWSKPDADWQEDELYSMIRRLQPNAMIINNTGIHKRGEKGNEYIDSLTYERGMPTPIDRKGMTKYVAGEMCETLNDHWDNADDINYKPIKQLIEEICDCRKVGANMLLNIGPSGDGQVPAMAKATMETIGYWMEMFGRAIYNGRPYITLDGKKEFVLRDVKDEKLFYAFKYNLGIGGNPNVTLENAGNNLLVFDGFEGEVKSVKWMDNSQELKFSQEDSKLSIACTNYRYGQSYCVRVAEIRIK